MKRKIKCTFCNGSINKTTGKYIAFYHVIFCVNCINELKNKLIKKKFVDKEEDWLFPYE